MKQIKVVTGLFLITLSGFSQVENLFPEAKEIKLAYENLIKNPDSPTYQEKYINVFPENSIIFKKVFAPPKFDQLYNGHLYIFKLYELSQKYPDKIGYKLVNLCVGLKEWEADAVGYVQKVTIQYANTNYLKFISLAKQLTKEDLSTLIGFLADKENHRVYHDYQDFMEKLKKNNEESLYAQFKNAKENRINEKDH